MRNIKWQYCLPLIAFLLIGCEEFASSEKSTEPPIDDDPPATVVISIAEGQKAFTNSMPIQYKVTFSKAIDPSLFTINVIENSGSASQVDWQIENSGDDTVFMLSATIDEEGSVLPTINSDFQILSSKSVIEVLYDVTTPTSPSALAFDFNSSLFGYPELNWSNADDSLSGIDYYEIEVYRKMDDVIYRPWFKYDGGSLTNAQTPLGFWYYLKMRAVDKAGNRSDPVTLDGWKAGNKLLSSDGSQSDFFGHAVSISGDVAIVGASFDDDLGTSSGSVYVFRLVNGNWVEEAKLTASDGAADDRFGFKAEVDGNVIAVGSRYDDNANGDRAGSAYIYRFDGTNWNEEAILTASDGANYDFFGSRIDLDGDVVAISAWGDNHGAEFNQGSAYVFRFDGANWNEEAKLTASDMAADDWFGVDIGLSGNVIVVGSYQDDDMGTNSGSAYVYRFDGANWNEEAKLTGSNTTANDQFGWSVAIDNDAIAVAAYLDDTDGFVDSGSVYTFRYDGANWNEENHLTPTITGGYYLFGNDLDLSGDKLLVGAVQSHAAGDDSGAAYLYTFNGTNWADEQTILGSDTMPFDDFGQDVSIDGDRLIIGSELTETLFDDVGSAHIFDLPF